MKDTMLAAMGNIYPQRLLDPRFFDPEMGDEPAAMEPFHILSEP